ncbi:MAG: ABC transporter ATP-binding protein [Candidatus Schekmanbacteria bacterium]|nr:ABC transporter ATP-binding protein [Candidatus Schekmanbacteria bacterium]
MPLLEINNLITYYGLIQILKEISLRVEEGEIVCLLGSNGAGKSTTMKSILGLVRAHSGEINFRGQRIDNLSAAQIVAAGIATVPESRRIFPRLSVEENLQIGAYIHKASLPSLQPQIEQIYNLFPRLKERRRQAGGTLSGGEQQMLAIGRALMAKPKLLLMDEPSMGLSPALVDKIFEIIQQINRSGTAILLVEQNAHMALSIARRGYVLQTGSLVAHGTGDELLHSEEIRSAYLGE